MNRLSLGLTIAIALCALCTSPLHAQLAIGNTSRISFASIDEGRQILTARDDFVRLMSPFDRAVRMKTAQAASEKDYLAFVARHVLAWEDDEIKKVTSAFQGILGELAALALPFPEDILMVKTSGREEGEAAYTRANAVVFPKSFIKNSTPDKLQRILSHELFHVLSRENANLRDQLYATIGFTKCNELTYPPSLKSRRITNPDAPRNDHCIRIQVGDNPHWAVPILYSRTEKFNPDKEGGLFSYLQFRLLLVSRDEDTRQVSPLYEGKVPRLVNPKDVTGFFEQVGKNTGYIIHPEEILADNFALLVARKEKLPSPAIVRKMRAVLKKHLTEQEEGKVQ